MIGVSVFHSLVKPMTAAPNPMMKLYQKCTRWPGGQALFSRAVCFKAPYFGTVKPRITELRTNYCQATITKRRAVENHIGTVHVIAICNGLEFAMGVVAETSIPTHLRWIPKGMDVRYTAKANSDIRVIAEVAQDAWENGPEVPVTVRALRDDDEVVVEGIIHLWVTEKPGKGE